MRNFFLTILAIAGATSADADRPLACSNTPTRELAAPGDSLPPADDDETIFLEAGEFSATLGDDPTAVVGDGVIVRRGNKLAGAERARIDASSRALHLDGNVRYEDPGTSINSDSAEFSYDSGRIRFTGAEFTLGGNNARGSAAGLEINETGEVLLDDVRYTTCPPGSNDWEMRAGDIDIDTREGVGTARNIQLRFQGVPILYAPYLSFPIGEARKTGILTPEIGGTSRSGTEVVLPWYWNIAANYDATITPRLLTDRGLQLQTEFRYLSRLHDGEMMAAYLGDDDLTGNDRVRGDWRHRSRFGGGWRGLLDYAEVSDGQYFEDLGGSLSASSTTHLERIVQLDRYTTNMAFVARVQDYQTLDDVILPEEKPYRRVPQLLASGYWPGLLGRLGLGFASEVANFDRDVGATGWRYNLAPRAEIDIGGPGWFIRPGAQFDYTRYELDDRLPGEPESLDRSVPISSVDVGLVLERAMANGNAGRIQTLEPRLLYVNIPFRDQDTLPVFDTIGPDLNLVQLFRRNRYLGVDRIGDTEQLSIGITSRVIDVDSGRELMQATIGQTRYLGDRLVTLPGEPTLVGDESDYIAEVRFLLFDNVNFDIGHQWGSGVNRTTKSEARLQYRPRDDKILNLAYRFRRDSLEQGDVSWSWPVSSKWNFVGRYNFSFRDDEVLEQFFGLEYESCCWGLRVVSRRHISTRDGTRDSSIGLQLVLKGMTSVGTAADKLLERGILGYSADLR